MEQVTYTLLSCQNLQVSGTSDVYLTELPEFAGEWYKFFDQGLNFHRKFTRITEVSCSDDREDLVDGSIGGQSTVVDHKLSFQTLRNVISTSPRLNHGSQELFTKQRAGFLLKQNLK